MRRSSLEFTSVFENPGRVGAAGSSPPLRIRIEDSAHSGFFEWKVLDALVQLSSHSDLAIDVECVTADGASVIMSLV